MLTDAVREELNAARRAIIESHGEQPLPADLPPAPRVGPWRLSPSLKRVVNASGVIVHTIRPKRHGAKRGRRGG